MNNNDNEYTGPGTLTTNNIQPATAHGTLTIKNADTVHWRGATLTDFNVKPFDGKPIDFGGAQLTNFVIDSDEIPVDLGASNSRPTIYIENLTVNFNGK